jgi:hypothetical protein
VEKVGFDRFLVVRVEKLDLTTSALPQGFCTFASRISFKSHNESILKAGHIRTQKSTQHLWTPPESNVRTLDFASCILILLGNNDGNKRENGLSAR